MDKEVEVCRKKLVILSFAILETPAPVPIHKRPLLSFFKE